MNISREIKRITKRGRHHSKDVGASNRHNLRLHRVLGTRQKRALDWIYNCACKIFWCNDRLFARRCRLILKKALNECFFVAYFFGASRVWHSYSRTQPCYLQWPRYLDEEQERHGLKQNPMYIWYMILEQLVSDAVIREPNHTIYNDLDIWMKNKKDTAWNKTQCTFGTWFWSNSCLTQLFANPTILSTMTSIFGWRTRKTRLETKPNVHLVHDFGASRAWRSYSPNSAVIVWRRDKLNW